MSRTQKAIVPETPSVNEQFPVSFPISASLELSAEELASLPDFLIISPAKTGTTWLAENLGRHPRVFISPKKGVKYFCHRLHHESLDWYLSEFRDGIGKIKGEASPTYCLLPVSTIRQIYKLMPRLKLVFLMREPVDRAWSHAKHSFAVKEATFSECAEPIDSISDRLWKNNVRDDWNRLFGDYLGQLRRWLQVFPKDQIFLGFFETLAEAPVALMADVLRFLGIDSDLDCQGRIVTERINPGLSYPLAPKLERALVAIHQDRTCRLQQFLEQEFHMQLPARWQRTLRPPTPDAGSVVSAFRVSEDFKAAPENRGDDYWDVSDERLMEVLAGDRMQQPLTELFERDFLGFNLVRHRRSVVAVRSSLGPLDLDQLSPQWWSAQIPAGNAVIAEDPTALKAQILKLEMSRWDSRVASLEQRAQQVQSTLAQVDVSLRILASSQHQIQALKA